MRDIVPKIRHQYKASPHAFLLPVIVVLVGVACFGLGRLSANYERGGLLIRLPDGTTQTAAVYQAAATLRSSSPAALTSGTYVASKSGTRYYLPSCSGAARIKEENKVWFNTVEDAVSAGYSAAANCPGL